MIYNKNNDFYINNINLLENTTLYKDNINIDLHNLNIIYESILLEDFDIGEFFNNIKKIIIKAFKKFTDIFSSIVNSFYKLMSNNNNLSEKFKYSIYNGFNILKDKNEEVIGIAYDTEKINRYSKNISGYRMRDQISFLKNIAKSDARYNGKYDEYVMNRKGIIEFILDDDTDYNYETIEELVSHIEKDIIITDNINLLYYYNSGENICKILRGITHKDIKEEYKYVKEIVSDCIEKIDKAYKTLTKNNSKTHTYDIYTGKKLLSELANHVIFIQNACQSITVLLSQTRFNELVQARKFALRCISAYEEENNKQGG